MSLFSNKLKEFLGNNWDNQIDINLNNQLIKKRNAMLDNQMQAQEFIQNFMQANATLISKASQEFQQKINDLTTYLTEEYHGYWETTSLSIKDKKGKILNPDVINRIKKMGLEDYGTKIRADLENPKFALIVPTISLSNIKSFEDEVKAINPNLVIGISNSSSRKHNIASKMNKINNEKNKLNTDYEDNYYKVMNENNNINDLMFMEDIETGISTGYEGMNECNDENTTFDTATKMLNKENLAYESEALRLFISKNLDKVRSICESADSQIDTYRLYALMESEDLKENTTADINVPQFGITGLMRKRLNGFDPYGKNLANKNNGSKTIVKLDDKTLHETICKINLDKTFILGTDIDTTNKYSNILIEHEGEKTNVVIDRNKFIDFIQRNADADNYMDGGVLNEKKYFKSRTNAFVGVLLKEYFKSMLSESNNEGFNVEDYRINGDSIEVDYYYAADTDVRTISVNFDDFENFIKDLYSDVIENNPKLYYQQDESSLNNENPRGNYHFNFEFFMEHNGIGHKEIISFLKQYIMSRGLLNEAKIIKEEKQIYVDDYNEWKDNVATLTRNNYRIKRSNNNTLNTSAVNADNQLVGEWNPAKTQGWFIN